MTQAAHGGGVAAFCRRYECREGEVLDFSSSLNWFLPEIGDADWLRLKRAASAYGDPAGGEISRLLAGLFGYDDEQVLATAGAIEAIYLSAQLFCGRRVLIGAPGFVDYGRAFTDCEVRWWDFSPEAEELEWAEVVVLGSPNNPDGTRHPIDALSERWPGKVWLVDEAFVDFSAGGSTTTPSHEVIVFRSLTKSWRIPGLRLGFLATANRSWKEQLSLRQAPWSISALAQAWAMQHLNSTAMAKVEVAIRGQLRERDRLMGLLRKLPDLTVHPSDANFFLVELRQGEAARVIGGLGREGIMVRDSQGFRGLSADHFLRLAVRPPEDNDRLVAVLAKVMGVSAPS